MQTDTERQKIKDQRWKTKQNQSKKKNLRASVFLLLSLIIVMLLLSSCGSEPVETEQTASLNAFQVEQMDYDSMMFKDDFEREAARRSLVFEWLLDTATNQDTALLVRKLNAFYGLPDAGKRGYLESVRKQRLYGAKDSVHVLEYVYAKDTFCKNHPHKRQFLFDPYGRLLHEDKAQEFRFIEVWEEKAPLLMTLETTCEGEGKHHFYKYQNGRLIDIYNVLFEYVPQTYDAKADEVVFKPYELTFSVEDVNGDAKNDLVFSGQQLWLTNEEGRRYSERRPFARRELFYAFVYDPGKDQFVEAKNYKEEDKLLKVRPERRR